MEEIAEDLCFEKERTEMIVANTYESTLSEKEVKDYLRDFCDRRFAKYSNPCKTCKYRNPVDSEFHTCIFDNCPRDWDV